MAVSYRQQAYELVDKLSDSTLADLLTWAQSRRDQQKVKSKRALDFTPVALGGLWQGLRISEEEITRIRQEMWAGFGEIDAWVSSSRCGVCPGSGVAPHLQRPKDSVIGTRDPHLVAHHILTRA